MKGTTARVDRLSFNTATAGWKPLAEVADACARRGVGWLGIWREDIQREGLERCVALLRAAGTRASSVCRGGFFAAPDAAQRRARIADNLRAIDETAALGADTLVLVCGGQSGCALDDARAMVRDGIAELVEYAARASVRLGIEPLHPMYAADRSVVVTLEQALDLALEFPTRAVGVIIDVYHVWWDPNVYRQIERARGRILGFHVNDWQVPVGDPLMSRRVMGDGVIELRRMRRAVDDAGYSGPIEVEVFNDELASRPAAQVIDLVAARYIEHVAEGGTRGD